MKIAVCTTFPNYQYDVCASEMIQTFNMYWPKEIKLYIQLDEQPVESFKELNNKIIGLVGEERIYIAGKFDDEQHKFIEKWKDHKPKSYLDEVVKFSHKVFALEKCADAIKDDVDYLIWLDADVITKKQIDYEYLKEILPGDDEVISYLNRKELHGECGFVAYNMKNGGYELLRQMKNEYLLDGILQYKTGYTDCHVLDFCVKGKKFKNLSPDYVYGVTDINIWPKTKLAERMAHRKGNRKFDIIEERKGKMAGNNNGVVDSSNLNIKTKNCLDHDKIRANVSANVSQIRGWANLCNPVGNQSIVICSAGPSLANHIDEIKQHQKDGAKIVCVKHAIDTLKMHNIKPWAVVLLDPRAHVEGFIKDPDQDVIYFVASMCDPSVVRSLNNNKCKVVGYHAFVNAGEMELMIPSDLPVSGGSGTATRSIGLFCDMFGFKTFHLYGYDLCHYLKPDLNEKLENGNPKYMEVSIGTNTYKNKYITRTFWTEGQLLAQANELRDLYKDRKDINLTVYGDGLAGWQYRHHRLYQKWRMEYNDSLEKKRTGTPTIDEYISAITRGNDLSRGV